MEDGGKTKAYEWLLLVLSLSLFFIEKVLFHWTDVLSDIAFSHQLLIIEPDDIEDDWARKWNATDGSNNATWKNDAAHVLNTYGQAMVVPILLSLFSLLPYLYKKEAHIGTKLFEFFLIVFQFYPQYTAMKLMYQVGRDNNPLVNQDGTFSKKEWSRKRDKFDREIGCNEAILEALLQFNIVIIGGRIFLGIILVSSCILDI